MAVVCLVNFGKLPAVSIDGADKYVHVFMHFVFVTLWCQHFMKNTGLMQPRVFAKAISFSILYGCLIEIAQEYLTTTRQADLKDVAANFAGALLAVLLRLAIGRFTRRNKV